MAQSRSLLIAGPTGVGKSAVANSLAVKLGGELISVDSMQVYRGMDIGTAKPSASERSQVRHHLVDIVDLADSFDAAEFVLRARRAVAEIERRGRIPIFCGGTGLYFQAFLYGLGDAPAADAQLRAELEHVDLPELLKELERTDPESFQAIDRSNRRRVVRAVGVIRLTGKPFSTQRAVWQKRAAGSASGGPAIAQFGLSRTREDLGRRIDARVDAMFSRGLVKEVESLIAQGLTQNRTAMQALGYRQVVEYLQGKLSLSDTVALIKQSTRQYAKRQMTWFRRQLALDWVALSESEATESAVSRIWQRFSSG